MNRENAIAKFEHFFRSITPEDKVAVIHHTDPDGVCSGVIAAKLVERLRGRRVDLRYNQRSDEHYLKERTLHLLHQRGINKVIFTDLSIDEKIEPLKKLEAFAQLLVLDHHKIINDISSKQTVLVNSSFVSKIPSAKYCAAKLVYDLGKRLVDISDLDWVAAVGVIGDMGGDVWSDWLAKVFRKYNLTPTKDWFHTPLGKVSAILSAAESYNDRQNVPLCFKTVYTAKNYKDIMKSQLLRFKKAVEGELSKWLKLLKKQAVVTPDYVLFMVVPRYNIKASLSTILSLQFPHKTIVVYELRGQYFHVSARRRDGKKDMSHLMKASTSELVGASAGGHVPAAGATVRTVDFSKFLKKLIALLQHQN